MVNFKSQILISIIVALVTFTWAFVSVDGAWQSSASNSVAGGQHHPSATGGATGGNQPQSGSGSSPHGPPMPQPPAGMKPGTATGSDSATGANNNKSSDPGPAGNSNATTVPRPANGTATDVRPTVAVAAALALVGVWAAL